MPGREIKWTQELRSLLYRSLKQQFGPFCEWEAADYPKHGKKPYEVSLKEIACFLSSLTGESFHWTAVRQQVRWATSKQSSVNNQSYARQFILNKAAALEEGFLSSADLPSLMLVERA